MENGKSKLEHLSITSRLFEQCVDWPMLEEPYSFTKLTEVLSDSKRLNREMKFLFDFAGINRIDVPCTQSIFSDQEQEQLLHQSRGEFQKSNAYPKQNFKKESLRSEIKDANEKLKTINEESMKILTALFEFKKHTKTCSQAQKILKDCNIPENVDQRELMGK